MATAPISPFAWRKDKRASTFADDVAFTGYRTGRTPSQTVSASVARIERETGRNPGTITGISKKADQEADSWARRRRQK